MRKALVIGIDAYPNSPLHGCVNDAIAIGALLETNGDGSPNFSVRTITSNEYNINSGLLHDLIGDLFSGNAETVLLFFAGHGLINPDTNAGYIVAQDGRRGAWGFSLSELVGIANNSYPRIKSTIIILDSCHSGYAGEVAGIPESANISLIGNGVTILTACHRDGTADEQAGQGIFTEILIDGLRGSSADVCGRITPASIYSHVDQTLGRQLSP